MLYYGERSSAAQNSSEVMVWIDSLYTPMDINIVITTHNSSLVEIGFTKTKSQVLSHVRRSGSQFRMLRQPRSPRPLPVEITEL